MNDLETGEAQGGAPEWMVTFADLMSLLMTFFVLLLSFSNMEIVKFRTMAGSVRNALGLKSEFDLSDTPMGNKLLPYEDPKEGDGGGTGREAHALREELDKMLRAAGMPESAKVRLTDRGVVLQVHGDLLFASGETQIRAASFPLLERLASYIPRTPYLVDVQGHTDDIPIASAAFPSNWELSAARAGSAVRFLVERGVPPLRLRAVGLADTQPVASNQSSAGRTSNRRVEFLFATPLTTPQKGAADQPTREHNQNE